MPISTSPLAEFRRKIKDVRHSARAFGVAIDDPRATRAICEVTQGHLIFNVIGGDAPSLDLDLTSPKYDTIGELFQIVSRAPGYRASLDEDVDLEHTSVDIEQFGPIDIRGTGVDIQTHVFADSELSEILQNAVTRHNPSFTASTVPPQEWAFIFPLAQAGVCRIQAYDVSKRKGVDRDTKALLMLADSFERQYHEDIARLSRALQSPREANSNLVDEGDIMLGSNIRRNLRTGFKAPLSQTIPPDAAVLVELDEHDIEDDNIRVNWQRNKNYDFFSYELWMDSQPDVVRTREGGLIFAGTPVAYLTSEDTRRNSAARLTTSVMIFRSFGSNSNSSRSSFSTFVEEFGQLIRSFSVGNLESETTYYFRLYIVNINYVSVGSNVVGARTKPLRARFNTPGTYVDRTSGPAGTTVTVSLDPTKGAFTADHTFKVGEKVVTPTIVTPYQIQVVIPSFQNLGRKDLAIISPNRLLDVRSSAFTVSSS